MRQEYMRRAIELAKRGLGRVNPNPLVGAVIVKDDHIIAEGYHARYGDLHAERSAFSKLKDPAEAIGAEMYVTLEPCCHQESSRRVHRRSLNMVSVRSMSVQMIRMH